MDNATSSVLAYGTFEECHQVDGTNQFVFSIHNLNENKVPLHVNVTYQHRWVRLSIVKKRELTNGVYVCPVTLFITGDFNFFCNFFGHVGYCTYPCLFCYQTLSNIKNNGVFSSVIEKTCSVFRYGFTFRNTGTQIV